MDIDIASSLFITAIILPVLFYHSLIYIKTGDKIDIAISFTSFSFALYALVYSKLTQILFTDSISLFIVPIIEIITSFSIITCFFLLTKNHKKINQYKGYYFFTILHILLFLASIIVFIQMRSKNNFNSDFVSILFFVHLLIIAYIIYNLITNKDIQLPVMFILYTQISISISAVCAYFIPFLASFKYTIIHLPITLYTMSLLRVSAFIPFSVKEEYKILMNEENVKPITENSQNQKEKIKEKIEEKIEEKTALFDFSKILKHKISIYNELPSTYFKIDKTIEDEVVVETKQSIIDNAIYSLLNIIKNNTTKVNSFITLKKSSNAAYLTTGHFFINNKDRSLTMDKVRLTEIKKAFEVLNATMNIKQSKENDLISVHLTIPLNNVQEKSEITSDKPVISNLPSIIIISDANDTFNYLNKSLIEYFSIIRCQKKDIDAVLHEQLESKVIIIAMSDDAINEDIFYYIDSFKEFSQLPIILINTLKPQYIALKNYRLITTDYLLRPIDPKTLISKINEMKKLQRVHNERNIQVIEKKIDKTDDVTVEFSTRFDNKSLQYSLSENEKKIVLLLLKGLEYNEISKRMNLNYENIFTLINAVYQKTNVETRVELIDLFIK